MQNNTIYQRCMNILEDITSYDMKYDSTKFDTKISEIKDLGNELKNELGLKGLLEYSIEYKRNLIKISTIIQCAKIIKEIKNTNIYGSRDGTIFSIIRWYNKKFSNREKIFQISMAREGVPRNFNKTELKTRLTRIFSNIFQYFRRILGSIDLKTNHELNKYIYIESRTQNNRSKLNNIDSAQWVNYYYWDYSIIFVKGRLNSELPTTGNGISSNYSLFYESFIVSLMIKIATIL